MENKTQIKQRLSKVFDLDVDSERLMSWINYFCEHNTQAKIFLGLARAKENKLDLIDAIIGNDQFLNYMIVNAKFFLVPDPCLKWIDKEGVRIIYWLRKYIEHNLGVTINQGIHPLQKDAIIYNIDTWNNGVNEKIEFISTMKSSWKFHIQRDGITAWLKGKPESEICDIALDCLRRSIKAESVSDIRIENFTDLLCFFDNSNLEIVELEKIKEKIKNRWNQRNYREKHDGKKQCNLLLTSKGMARLERLAKEHNISKSNIVDILLLMEEKEKAYIKKRLLIVEHAVNGLLEATSTVEMGNSFQEPVSTFLPSENNDNQHKTENSTPKQKPEDDLGNTAPELLV